jgi:hypothetical protein
MWIGRSPPTATQFPTVHNFREVCLNGCMHVSGTAKKCSPRRRTNLSQLSPHTNSGDPAHELGRSGWPDAPNSRRKQWRQGKAIQSGRRWRSGPRWRSCGGGEVAAVENLETLPAVTVQAEREKFQRSKWSSWEAQGAVEKLKLPAGESERESGRAGERGSVCAFAFE